jgi:hypothetical protein
MALVAANHGRPVALRDSAKQAALVKLVYDYERYP